MKYIKYILILMALIGVFNLTAQINAQTDGYKLLAPLPNPDGTSLETFDPTTGLGAYLNLMIKLIIGLAAVLSVVMIVVGGMQYMTSELVHSKEAGKERIMQAILGLLIALGAYALLYTINPDLLIVEPEIPVNTPAAITPTPAEQENWYFEYRNVTINNTHTIISNSAPSPEECEIRRVSVASNDNSIVLTPCSKHNTRPTPSPLLGTCFWYNDVIKETQESRTSCENRTPPGRLNSSGICFWEDRILMTTRGETKDRCEARIPPPGADNPIWRPPTE